MTHIKETPKEWSCTQPEKGGYPDRYGQRVEECRDKFLKVEEEIMKFPEETTRRRILKEFQSSNVMEHITGTESNTCYKDHLFHKNGWCKVAHAFFDEEWGFCSSSCRNVNEVK